jgi:hypothetical protein
MLPQRRAQNDEDGRPPLVFVTLAARRIKIAAANLDEQLTKISAELPVLPTGEVSENISKNANTCLSSVNRGQQKRYNAISNYDNINLFFFGSNFEGNIFLL